MARKKWRLKKIPPFTYESAPSMTKAYERVIYFRDQYAAGTSHVHHVNVEVDEGHGRGWELFEVFRFDSPGGAS